MPPSCWARDLILPNKEIKLTQPPSLLPNLPESTSQRLNSYVLAAAAAGVGMLAAANPGNAKIVYTPSNIPINVNGALVNLDLNHDGINDFQFAAGYSGPGFRRGGVIARREIMNRRSGSRLCNGRIGCGPSRAKATLRCCGARGRSVRTASSFSAGQFSAVDGLCQRRQHARRGFLSMDKNQTGLCGS